MLKRRRNQVLVVAGSGLCALLLGAALPMTQSPGSPLRFDWLSRWTAIAPWQSTAALRIQAVPTGAVAALVSQAPTQRAEKLQALAEDRNSPDRAQARYLLASDLIRQGRGEAAVALLENLEQDYPLMAPYIALQRAQAYSLAGGSPQKAEAAWKALLEKYPQEPVAAEALYVLGQKDASYWDRAIADFPAHPRSVEIAQTRLRQNPKQPELLLLITRHGLYLKNYLTYLNQLVEQPPASLTPEDWEAIAFGYWEKQEYGEAGRAYARAPQTPRNLYRAGRGLQLAEQTAAARQAYQRLIQTFPEAEETATGLIRLAAVSDAKAAVPYLDQVLDRFAEQFPEKAAEALIDKAEILDSLNSRTSAQQARQSVLSQYGSTEAAAELRWQQAQRLAKTGDLRGAWQWAQPITEQNPTSEIAPQAGFWVGKWAERLGNAQEARSAFRFVLSNYPESYYAWRSANILGLEVGGFDTVRSLTPEVVKAPQRFDLLAGSEVLRELHRLGQDQDAWTRWQIEFENPMEPTVAEQFTDGIVRLGVGDNLEGLFMISSLAWRENPEDQKQYQALRKQPAYWQALYPFPFRETIEKQAQANQLNPLLVTALIRQESRFEPAIESVVGATGLMQVMPETADWIASQTKWKGYSLAKPEDNIKFGTWYLDHTHEEYDNNSLLAVASYNAGPGSVAGWLKEWGGRDVDEFVEGIPFPETRGYVKSVFENYWNYARIYSPQVAELLASQR